MFKNKYIKYKTKYLELKQYIGGGRDDCYYDQNYLRNSLVSDALNEERCKLQLSVALNKVCTEDCLNELDQINYDLALKVIAHTFEAEAMPNARILIKSVLTIIETIVIREADSKNKIKMEINKIEQDIIKLKKKKNPITDKTKKLKELKTKIIKKSILVEPILKILLVFHNYKLVKLWKQEETKIIPIKESDIKNIKNIKNILEELYIVGYDKIDNIYDCAFFDDDEDGLYHNDRTNVCKKLGN